MVDPKKVAAWIAIPGVTLGAILAIGTQWGGIEDNWELMAQEAGAIAAEVVVDQRMEPLEAKFDQFLDLKRREEDRNLQDRCESRAEKRGEEFEEYELRCIEESNLRWLWWEYDDCVLQASKECTEPREARP